MPPAPAARRLIPQSVSPPKGAVGQSLSAYVDRIVMGFELDTARMIAVDPLAAQRASGSVVWADRVRALGGAVAQAIPLLKGRPRALFAASRGMGA